jgi:hypothetical protein
MGAQYVSRGIQIACPARLSDLGLDRGGEYQVQGGKDQITGLKHCI